MSYRKEYDDAKSALQTLLECAGLDEVERVYHDVVKEPHRQAFMVSREVKPFNGDIDRFQRKLFGCDRAPRLFPHSEHIQFWQKNRKPAILTYEPYQLLTEDIHAISRNCNEHNLEVCVCADLSQHFAGTTVFLECYSKDFRPAEDHVRGYMGKYFRLSAHK